MGRLVECVPNFSEGCKRETIDSIARTIALVEGVSLLNIDRGEGANRTVFTFIGSPEGVVEAAFRAIEVAVERIDMAAHSGSHPRIGAADVVPLIPIEGVTLEQAASYADHLARRVARELNVAVYCYGAAAKSPLRENLASCRSGEYEGISAKIKQSIWRPDYGPMEFCSSHVKSGISVVGARDFLVAINFNLTTDDAGVATKIAQRVRYSGYVKDGVRVNGALRGVKAIGWYIAEYGFAQVSINVVDIDAVSLDQIWCTLKEIAESYGITVTGTELIGLIPKRVLLDAACGFGFEGDEYHRMHEVAEFMNFSEIEPFILEDRVLEYVKPIKF